METGFFTIRHRGAPRSMRFLLAFAITGVALLVQGETTIDPGNRHAWGANIGWIDARPSETDGAVIGQTFCSGFLWSANCGWIALGQGSPANGWRYANDSNADWGVNHDGEGRLAGYAYGANVGWIVFEQTSGQPRVDLRTGDLAGYAWGANVGWIGLSNVQAHVRTGALLPGADSDGDGMPDGWESAHGLDPATANATADTDGDGVTDLDEYRQGRDPCASAVPGNLGLRVLTPLE